MATIDEILAAMPEPAADAAYEYLTIDPETRTITVPEAEEIFGVEQDTKTERKHFLCPRFVGDGLDLASCFLSIKYRNANGEKDEYLVDDVALVAGDYITFSWLLYTKPIAYKGEVQFRLYADNGAGKDWGTTLASGTVLEGLETELEAAEEQTADVIAQLRATVEVETAAVEIAGTQQIQAVQEAAAASTQEARAQIEAKGEATLATIPEDYTALQAQADKLTRDRAAAIVCAAEGSAVVVSDASNDPLQGLRIFGRSTQDGTPSPEAPVEIVSLAAPTVQVCGRNLVKTKAVTQTLNGLEFTVHDDGSFTVKGTATGSVYLGVDYDVAGIVPGEVYALSGCPAGGSASTYRLYAQTIDGKVFAGDIGAGTRFTGTDAQWQVLFAVYIGTTVDLTVHPLLRLASIQDTTFEPYTGQALAIITPNGLPGIPVTTGGNYTDASGQAWIADEVDLARGVYVQRVHTEQRTFSYDPVNNRYSATLTYAAQPACADDQGIPVMCDILPFNKVAGTGSPAVNGIRAAASSPRYIIAYYNGQEIATATVAYPMQNPIERTLTAEEVQGFLALHSNKPTTTVLNDAGAWMAVDYAADPKLYIDRKIAELASASK